MLFAATLIAVSGHVDDVVYVAYLNNPFLTMH